MSELVERGAVDEATHVIREMVFDVRRGEWDVDGADAYDLGVSS